MSDRNLRIRVLMEGADKLTKPMRDAAAGSSRLAQTLKVTRDQLKGLERAQADIGEFRQLRTGLRDTERRMQDAQTRATQLGRALAEADKPTKALQRDFAAARRESEQLTREHQQQSNRLQDLRSRLSAAGVSTRNLVSDERRLRDQVRQTNDSLRDQERRLGEVADRTRRFADARDRFSQVQGTATGLAAGGAAAIGTGMAVAAPLAGAASDAMEFESVMTDVNQKIGQARAAGAAMGERFRRTAIDANQFVADLQRGADTLAGAGMSAKAIEGMLRPIGRTATAYKADMEELARTTAATHQNLGVSIADTGRALGVMAQAGKAGSFEMRDMARDFPALTASMQSLGSTGVSAVGDLAAALQIVRRGAGDSSTAANNLQNLLAKINSEETLKNFKAYGVDIPAAMRKAARDGRSPIEEIVRLTQQITAGDPAKLATLFSDMQVQQALRPLMKDMQDYQRIRAEAMGAGEGVIDTDFAERMGDNAEKVRQLQIRAKDLSITLGNQLLPMVASGAATLNGWATWLGNVANRHPTLIRMVAMAGAVIGGVLLVMGSLGIALAALVAPFAALSAAGALLGIGLLPLIGIAAGVIAATGLLAAAGYYLYDVWGDWPRFWGDIWAVTKAIVLAISPLSLLMQIFNPAISWLRSLDWSQIGRDLMAGLVRGIKSMFPTLTALITGIGQMMPDRLRRMLGIHSPSRVFAQLGSFTMAGLEQGIARDADRPIARIADLSSKMTRALAIGSAGGMALTAGHAAANPSGPISAITDHAEQIARALSAGAGTRNTHPRPSAAAATMPSAPAPGAGARSGDTYHFHMQFGSGDPADIEEAIRRALDRIKRDGAGRGFFDGSE